LKEAHHQKPVGGRILELNLTLKQRWRLLYKLKKLTDFKKKVC